jgi:hypothetical protein
MALRLGRGVSQVTGEKRLGGVFGEYGCGDRVGSLYHNFQDAFLCRSNFCCSIDVQQGGV